MATGTSKAAIIGTGLMGGSLGLALHQARVFDRIIGYDVEKATARRALGRGAIAEIASGAAEAVEGADFVFIATPVEAIPGVFFEMVPVLAPGAVVTDLGSTKSGIIQEIAPKIPADAHFIGGHPIAGAEQEGIDAAEPDLYRGCVWILTPTETTDPEAYGALVRILGLVGARILSLDPSRHDELVALTSHLPQLLSSALMRFAGRIAAEEGGPPLIGAGGFRDMTRIAASSPEMWVEILRTNREAVTAVLRRFEGSLRELREAITTGEWEIVHKALGDARVARRALPGKPGVAASELVELLIPVPDRPGVLAEITTTVGEAGINIEDLRLVHSPEGGRGTIHLEVSGEDAAGRAIEIISLKGYGVQRIDDGT